MLNLLEKCKRPWEFFVRWGALIAIVVAFICILLVLASLLNHDFLPIPKGYVHHDESLPHNELAVVYYFAIVALTLALTLIAWSQLNALSKVASSDYLLQIDNRFHCSENLRAKMVIHKLYINSDPDQHSPEEVWKIIGDQFVSMRLANAEIENFMLLRNLLEFFETIGEFYHQGKLDIHEINDLMGYSIIKYYRIFKPYIDDRRQRRKDKNLHMSFEKLFNKITCIHSCVAINTQN